MFSKLMTRQRYVGILAFLLATAALAAFFSVSLRAYSTLYIELATENIDSINVSVEKNRSDFVLHKKINIVADGMPHHYAVDFPSAAPRAIILEINSGEAKKFQAKFESPLISADFLCPTFSSGVGVAKSIEYRDYCKSLKKDVGAKIVLPLIQKSGFNEFKINWIKFIEGILFAILTFFLVVFIFQKEKTNKNCPDKFDLNLIWRKLYLFTAYLFIGFIVFNIHTSSIGIWKNYVTFAPTSGVWLGEPKAIRSDEWLVQTPLIASEVARNFSLENQSLGADGSSLVAGVPVNKIYGYLQPRYWGFYLFGFEKGLSWLYSWRIFGLLFSGFVLFSLVTKKDFYLSILGSFWVFLSPFTQWWFGTNLPDMLIGMMGGVSSLYFLISSKRPLHLILSAFSLFIFTITFVFALYPPFQLPLFYLGVFILLGLFIRDLPSYKENNFWKIKAPLISLVLICAAMVLLVWYFQAKSIITIVQSSAYPGARVSLGGDFSLDRLFVGLFGQFLSENSYPLVLGNVCEAASFLLLFPLAWITMVYIGIRYRKFDTLNICLSIYLVLMIAWMFLGFPKWLAVGSQFSMSPPYRSVVGLGIGSIFLVLSVFASNKSYFERLRQTKVVLISLYVSGIILIAGMLFYLRNGYMDYFSPALLWFSLFLFAVWTYSFFAGNKKLFIIVTAIFFVNGFWVNPISSGVSVLKNSELKVLIQEEQSSNSGLWMVSPGTVYPQYFKALGANVWNGVRFISSPDEMKSIDPNGSERDIWYRYAHISFESLAKGGSPQFVLKQADLYELRLDPCSLEAAQLGITHFVFESQQDFRKNMCLESIRPFPVSGFWIYRRSIN